MKIITYATHSDGMFEQLMESGQSIEVLGWGTKWNGFMDKFTGVLKFLKTQRDDEIVVFLDGFDSIINKSLENLEKDFKSLGCKVLVSQEDKNGFSNSLVPECLTNYGKNKIFSTCVDGFTANTGLYMGYVKELSMIMEEISKSKFTDDQRAFNKVCSKFSFIKVDYKKKIFENLPSTQVKSSAYFVQYPATMNDSRVSRALGEYSEYFIPEIVGIFIIVFIFFEIVRRR